MAWTTPSTRATNFLVTSTVYNDDIINNLLYLANRPSAVIATTPGTLTTTSASWVDVSTTYYQATLNVSAGGRVLVLVQGTIYISSSAGVVGLRLLKNGADVSASATYGHMSNSTNLDTPFSIFYVAENQTAGSQTYKLQWYVTGGFTGRIRGSINFPMAVMEL